MNSLESISSETNEIVLREQYEKSSNKNYEIYKSRFGISRQAINEYILNKEIILNGTRISILNIREGDSLFIIDANHSNVKDDCIIK